MIQKLKFSYSCTTILLDVWKRLPVDVMLVGVLRDKDVQTYNVKGIQKDLRESVNVAKGNITDAQRKQTQEYNKRANGAPLEVEHHVLLANKKERGKGKLADVWNSAVHVVTWKEPSLPIYRVEYPTTKNSKVVHCNILMFKLNQSCQMMPVQ